MIVLDASVLIAHLDSTDAHHDRAPELLLSVVGDELAVSPITMSEVLVGPARAQRLRDVQAALRRLDVHTVALTDDAPARLSQLRATTSLRLPGCCVLLSAENAGAALATFDEQLAATGSGLGFEVRTS